MTNIFSLIKKNSIKFAHHSTFNRFASTIWRLTCNKYQWINLYQILPKRTQINQHLVQCLHPVLQIIPEVSNQVLELKERQRQKVIKVNERSFLSNVVEIFLLFQSNPTLIIHDTRYGVKFRNFTQFTIIYQFFQASELCIKHIFSYRKS